MACALDSGAIEVTRLQLQSLYVRQTLQLDKVTRVSGFILHDSCNIYMINILCSNFVIIILNTANTFDFTRANSGRSKGYMIATDANRKHQYINLTFVTEQQQHKKARHKRESKLATTHTGLPVM